MLQSKEITDILDLESAEPKYSAAALDAMYSNNQYLSMNSDLLYNSMMQPPVDPFEDWQRSPHRLALLDWVRSLEFLSISAVGSSTVQTVESVNSRGKLIEII